MHYDSWGMFYPKNGKLVEEILSYNFITTSKIRSKNGKMTVQPLLQLGKHEYITLFIKK